MKKLFILMVITGTLFAACKKDEVEPTYTKSQLIGKWKQTSPALEEGDMPYLSFSETEMKNSSDNGTSMSYDYTFDGKAIKYNMMFDVTLKINELTTTKLVVTQTISGFPGSEQYTYTKGQ